MTTTSSVMHFGGRAIEGLLVPDTESRVIYRDDRTPHFCLRVTPTSRMFFWEKTVRGRKRRVTIGAFPEITVDAARKRAEQISADYVSGIDVDAARRAERDEITFGELWTDYRANRRRKQPGKDSRALDYQWNQHLQKLASFKISEINYERARKLILGIRKTAPVHANRIQRQGRAMYNHARQELRWRGDNPFDFSQVSEKGRERKARLRPADMRNFLKGLDACSETMRVLFLTTLYTGRRVGEVRTMRWVDLDLDSGLWSIPSTKAGEPQQAVLPRALIELLAKRRKQVTDVWVFPAPSESGHVEQIKKAWAQVRQASGLRGLQARDLRRTLASWAQDVNIPIAVVQAQLGHADLGTTAKHYTNISQSVQRLAIDATVSSMIAAAGTK